MKRQPLNTLLAEQVVMGILDRVFHHPKIPVCKSDFAALEKASETFRKARNRLVRSGDDCEYLQSWILALGNKKLGIPRDFNMLPKSVALAVTGRTPC